MGRHTAARPRRAPWGRVALSLCVLLGLGSAGTLAYWTDTATVTTGSLQSGTLDLRIDGGAIGPGGTVAKSTLAMTSMVPGESVAVLVAVQNPAGSVGFRYRATAFASGTLAAALRWTTVPGATAVTNTTNAAGLRVGSCTGGTPAEGVSAATIGTTLATATPVVPNRRTVATNAAENVCVLVSLPDVGNEFQDKTASGTLTFDALQVGAS